jgi:hypothetical protein
LFLFFFNKILFVVLALGGGWAKSNMAKPFLAWGKFCGVSGANTAKLTWQTVQFFCFLDFSNSLKICQYYMENPIAQRTVPKWHITWWRLGVVAASTAFQAGY